MLLVKARAAMSQWILKTLYLGGGLGERRGTGDASSRGQGWERPRRGGEVSQGPGPYVFLQRTDTQKMPAARKQADMTM